MNKKLMVILRMVIIIISSTILFTGAFVVIHELPYVETINLKSLKYEDSGFYNCTSLGNGFNGDFENATVRWLTDATNLTIWFSITGYNTPIWFESVNSCGQVFLNRSYFLEYPYQSNMGGTWWRGIHTYIRSEIGETFNYSIIFEGFYYQHLVDAKTQTTVRLLTVYFGYVVWIGIILFVSKFEEDETGVQEKSGEDKT